MSLLNQYVLNNGQIGAFFERIRQAQAPAKFSQQFLKDIGFTSSNYRAYIPLFKGLGLVSEDGTPKSEYMLLLDNTQWSAVIARAIRAAYSDIFVMKAKPSNADKAAIVGKYKTTYNLNDLSAERAASTFLSLLNLADKDVLYSSGEKHAPTGAEAPPPPTGSTNGNHNSAGQAPLPTSSFGLNYNIQIHLPPTKDIEVYNAIFKSLREHLVA